MEPTLQKLLSPRIQKHCLPLFQDGHYKHAAHEAMILVESALKEKGQVHDKRFGKQLVESLFSVGGKGQYVKLRVPLGDDLQQQAQAFFSGVFTYYRNYTAHEEGNKIDEVTCLRIMIIASELLDLIDASSLTFEDIGGMGGLLKLGFVDQSQLYGILKLIDGYALPDGEADGLTEEIFMKFGADDLALKAIFDLDLARYEETDYVPTLEERIALWSGAYPPSVIGQINLTDLGYRVIEEIEKNMGKGE